MISRAALGHGLLQSKTLPARHDIAQPFVGRAVLVGGRGGGGEPALVDAAAVQAEGVEIVGMELEPLARLQEGARHPARGQAQQPAALGQRGFDDGGDFGFDDFERCDRFHIARMKYCFSPGL